MIFGRPLVKRFALCYRTCCLSCLYVCLSVLSVTIVHCGQPVGRIKMKLGSQVVLGPGHIVLHGDPPPPPPKGHSPPNVRPIAVAARGAGTDSGQGGQRFSEKIRREARKKFQFAHPGFNSMGGQKPFCDYLNYLNKS